MSYCCTVNLSRRNYFLANKNLLFYRCLFVYIIKRTLHGGLKIWILFSRGKNKILFCHSKIKFISSRHRLISSMSHSSDKYTYLQVSEVLDAHRYKSAMIVLRSCGMTVHVILIVQGRESVVWMDAGIHVLNLVGSDN